MKTKICLPIVKNGFKDVLQAIDTYHDVYDMFEVWVDYIQDISPEFIIQLQKKLREKLIIVFRRLDGKNNTIDIHNRCAIILLLNDTTSFIDLDIEKQNEELEFIKDKKLLIKTIVSFHDYDKTPRTSVLVKKIEKMNIYQPNIYKIATLCQSPKQAIALMHLLLDLKEEQKKTIILGMGDYGKITRIFGALYGNEITFTPETNTEETAKGQLTRTQLKTAIQILDS